MTEEAAREQLGPIGRAAVAYARKGWSVIPLHGLDAEGRCTCRMHGCTSPGKHPRISKWQRIASSDPGTVEGWWRHYGESANVGIVAGPSGLDIVDIDGDAGTEAYGRLTGGEFDTPLVAKTRRGWHLYFEADPDRPLRPFAGTGEMKGLDLRSGDSYVVAPPSRAVDGTGYSWAATPERGAPLPVMPDRLRAPFTRATSERRETTADRAGDPIPEGGRDNYLASIAGTMRRRGCTRDEIEALLFAINDSRCDPPLDRRDVERIAWSVSQYEPTDPLLPKLARGEAELPVPNADEPADLVFERAGFRFLDVRELLAQPAPEFDWLWRDLIERGEVAWLAGAGKVGKSMLALFLGCALVSGREEFLGRRIGEVPRLIYLDCENREKTVARRLHLAGVPVDLADRIRYGVLRGANLGSDEGLTALDLATRDAEGGLLVLDSLVGMHRSDEDKATEVRAFVLGIRQVAEKNGLTVIGLAHENRGGNIRGSLDWVNAVDSVLSMSKDETSPRHVRTLRTAAMRDSEGGGELLFTFDVFTDECGERRLAITRASAPDEQDDGDGGRPAERVRGSELAEVVKRGVGGPRAVARALGVDETEVRMLARYEGQRDRDVAAWVAHWLGAGDGGR